MNFLSKKAIKSLNRTAFASFMKNATTDVPSPAIAKPSYMKTKLSDLKAYTKLVLGDYRDVARDTLVSCKNNPVKASAYFTTIGAFIALYKTNPTYIDYVEYRKSYANELALVGNAYNRKTEYYLNSVDKLENADLLEIRSFQFFSFILQKNFANSSQLYEKQCAQLNNPSKYNIFNMPHRLLQFLGRVVDVGVANRFYFLDKNFQDYDIDEREWENKNKLIKAASV